MIFMTWCGDFIFDKVHLLYPVKVCFFGKNQSNEAIWRIMCNRKQRARFNWVGENEQQPCPYGFWSWDFNNPSTIPLLQVWYEILKLIGRHRVNKRNGLCYRTKHKFQFSLIYTQGQIYIIGNIRMINNSGERIFFYKKNRAPGQVIDSI